MIKWLLILLFPVASFSQKVIYQSSVFALPDSLLSKMGCGSITGDLVDISNPCAPVIGLTGTHFLTNDSYLNGDGHIFNFVVTGGGNMLQLAPGVSAELRAFNNAFNDGNESYQQHTVSETESGWYVRNSFNDGTLHQTKIEMETSADTGTVLYTSDIHTFAGLLQLNTVNSGALTDSILTLNTSTNIVNKIPISSLPHGTVTSVATGLGLSGGTITTSGTLLIDTASVSILSRQRAAATYAPISINGTVTSVSVTTANGVSGTVATATTTPAISLTLGAITPSSVNGNIFTTGSSTYTGTAAATYTFPDTSQNIGVKATVITTVADDTTTLVAAKLIPGFTFWGRANKKYRIILTLRVSCDNTGGLKVGVYGPSGATLSAGSQYIATATVMTTPQIGIMGAINNLSTAFNRANVSGGTFMGIAELTMSSTAGSIYVQYASTTGTQKSTMHLGSSYDIQEVQ